jgi:hypothetical protein
VAGVLPNELARRYSLIEPYGLFILLGLLFLGILGKLLSGPFEVLKTAIFQVFNLPF